MLLNKTGLYLQKLLSLLLLLLFCSCASQETRQAERLQAIELRKVEVEEALKRIPENWKVSNFLEPILRCNVKVAEITTPSKDGKVKPKVLLVHGLGDKGMEDWINLAPDLSRDYDLIALDLPGFGRSDKPEIKYSPSNYASVLHEIKRKYAPNTKLLVVGYSMGGAVSLRYADMYPEEVESLVLISVAGILERTTFLKFSVNQMLENYNDSSRYQSFLKVFKNPIGKFVESINGLPDPTQLLKYDKVWKKVFTGRERFNAGMSLIEEDFSKAIFNCKKPCTIVWGDKDNIAPLRTGQLLSGQLPMAELKVIEGSGHAPMTSHTRLLLKYIREGLLKRGEFVSNGREIVTNRENFQRKDRLYLRSESDVVIENTNYHEIILERCSGVTLKNVATKKITLEKTSVALENVKILSDSTALTAYKSIVKGTNLYLNGVTCIESDGSSLDLVGAHMSSLEEAVVVKEKSQLLFSISKLSSPGYSGTLHGSYRLTKQILDDHLQVNQ